MKEIARRVREVRTPAYCTLRGWLAGVEPLGTPGRGGKLPKRLRTEGDTSKRKGGGGGGGQEVSTAFVVFLRGWCGTEGDHFRESGFSGTDQCVLISRYVTRPGLTEHLYFYCSTVSQSVPFTMPV